MNSYHSETGSQHLTLLTSVLPVFWQMVACQSGFYLVERML